MAFAACLERPETNQIRCGRRIKTLLAYVTDRGGQDEIWVSSADGRTDHRPLVAQGFFGDDRTIMLASPTFSPDGRRIAYQRNAHKPVWPLRIWISQTAGGPPVPLLPPTIEGYQSAPTWSPDGQWIAYADWTDREWRLAKVRVGDEPTRSSCAATASRMRRRRGRLRRLDHVGNGRRDSCSSPLMEPGSAYCPTSIGSPTLGLTMERASSAFAKPRICGYRSSRLTRHRAACMSLPTLDHRRRSIIQ